VRLKTEKLRRVFYQNLKAVMTGIEPVIANEVSLSITTVLFAD
jgi:hypothetical protein